MAPFLTGEVVLSWSKGAHGLRGRSTVKVSLKTGDEAMARVRWNRVHEQVEGLVQMARLLANERAERQRSQRTVNLLPRETISTIAAQAKHGIVAERDQT